MMLDVFAEHLHLGFEQVVPFFTVLDLRNELLSARVLDFGLIQQVLTLFVGVERIARRRIEELFLDLGVNGEELAHLGRDRRFSTLRRFELLEQGRDFPVILFQQADRIHGFLRIARN